ncbi:alpha/beta hydrolase fold [Rhizobiales bacterium GAS113]|nr:alpha/beta hydrolase fold [Rhizobiales bacterium GAS113]
MNFIETSPGIHLNFVDWGQGKPLVMLHGWPFDLQALEYQMTALPEQGIRCIAYDRRGFGKSTKTWQGYDYDTLSDDLASVLEKLDLRDITLAGFSMGAGEVVRYFSRHGGKRVSRVVLISSIVPFMSKTNDNAYGIDRSVFDDMIDKLEADRPNFLTSFVKQAFGAGMLSLSVSNAFLDWARYLCLQASPRAAIDCGTIAAATAIGVALNFTALDPIKALFWSAVINGVVAVPIMVMMMHLAGKHGKIHLADPAENRRLDLHGRHGVRRHRHVRDHGQRLAQTRATSELLPCRLHVKASSGSVRCPPVVCAIKPGTKSSKSVLHGRRIHSGCWTDHRPTFGDGRHDSHDRVR